MLQLKRLSLFTAFQRGAGRKSVVLGSDAGSTGPKEVPTEPSPPVQAGGTIAGGATEPVQAGSSVTATSPTPAFVMRPSRGTDSICFNLPLSSNSKYNFLDVETDKRRSTSYIFTAKMGQNSVDEVKVDRKMKWGRPRTLVTVKKNDGKTFKQGRGVDVTVYGNAEGVVTYFVEIPTKWTQNGLLTELSKLQFTITKNGDTATISISNGPRASLESATASQVIYNSKTNEKCWFIKDLNTASLGINVDSFIIP
ncbi:uncharacterized protein LOC134244540 isoform X1 [Saccostrea cucullata]|uniref:uncharacterized protein LOC134244540 isoform X1 n=1 Tax=Saccostrea cuccullata TaxID=36930 RepID=UPI002ED3F3BD